MKNKEKSNPIGVGKSIKTKLVLYFTLLFISPFIIIGVIAYSSEKEVIQNRIKNHLTAIADIEKGRVESWIFERKNDARFLSLDESITHILAVVERMKAPSVYKRAQAYKYLSDTLWSMKRTHNYLDALILDSSGRIVASTIPSEIGQSRSDEDYFKRAVRQQPGRIYIQDVYKDRRLGKLAMAFSGPIMDPNDPRKVNGVVVLIIGMDESFYPIFAGWPGMGRTGDTLIFRHDRNSVVIVNRLRFSPEAPLSVIKEPPKASFLSSRGWEGVIEARDYRGVKVLAAYRYIPETRWGFIVKEDYSEVFAPVKRLAVRVALTIWITLMIVTALIYTISRRIADPIISLDTLTRKVARGDFGVRLPVKRSDEVGSLAVSFNNMASALAEYKRQVDEKNAELEKANQDLTAMTQSLEEKVKARTHELEDLNRALLSMMEDLDERTAALQSSQEEMKKFAGELEESRNRVRENLEIVERANIELRRIDRMKDHFLGMMSHELRTPLSLITGYSSNLMADTGVKGDARISEAVEGITKGAERLKTIVTEMLDVSQIDAKGLRLAFTPMNIGKLVEETVKELSSFIRERRQEVEIEDYRGLPDVLIDKKRIQQVLINLMGNAIKFTPDRGKINVSFRVFEGECARARDGEKRCPYLDVVINDSGIGLDREEIDRIFEKFYEVGEIDKHATSKYAFLGRGVGLGLPIARGIVEAHGGRLWAESPGYDPIRCPGSMFHVALPVNVEAREMVKMGVVAETREPVGLSSPAPVSEAAEAPPAPRPAADTGRKKILVVEDDPDILHLTRIVLESEYEVAAAEGGEKGIEKALGERPDLILLDIYMEDMNGYDVCKVLRKDERTKDIPIAMFTAGVQRWEVDEGYRSGADDYLTKPFKPAELIAKVDELLHRARTPQA